MRRYTVYLLMQTDLHVPGSGVTHHQEHIQVLPTTIVVAAQTLRLVPDAVNAVVCASDDG
jgi:hypothetical protein